jgi:hypothetical protein
VNLNPGSGHLTKLEGIIGFGKNGSGQVLTYLVLINIEGSHEINIADMIPAEIDMHKSRYKFILFCFLIVVNALNQGRGTIAHSYYGYIYLTQSLLPSFSTAKPTGKGTSPTTPIKICQ